MLFGYPALVGTAEVQFVAVFLGLHAAHDRTKFGQLHLPDSRQLVEDLLLFHPKLFVVGNLLPLATATDTEVLAERLCASRTIFVEPDDFSLHERVFLAANLQIDDVARYCPRYEHYHFIYSRQCFALGSVVSDGDVL